MLTGVNVSWTVFDQEGEDSISNSTFSAQDAGVTVYNENSLYINSDNSSGTYTIESYFILYSSQSVNKYSESICDTFDSTYFKSGRAYTVEIMLQIDQNDGNGNATVTQTFAMNMTANTPPANGECDVNPESGTVLFDMFNFSCFGWTGHGLSNDIEYNFIYDSLFLKNDYDSLPWARSILGNGNHTIVAVIIDDLNLPTCVDISVSAHISNITQLQSNLPISTVAEWLLDIYDNLTSIYGTTTTTGNVSNHTYISVTDVSIVTDIIYDLMTDYYSDVIETEASGDNETARLSITYEVVSEIVDFQSEIIESYIGTVGDEIDTYEECDTVLSVLTVITTPVITDIDNLVTNRTNGTNALYNSTLISTILNLIEGTIIEKLKNNVLYSNATADSLETETAQAIFGMLPCFAVPFDLWI